VNHDTIDQVIADFWHIKRKTPADIDETELRTRLVPIVRRYAALTDGGYRGRIIKSFRRR
jgi:hypothetical protein